MPPLLAVGGAALAVAGIRVADRALRRDRGPWAGLLAGLAGCAALASAAATVPAGTIPDAHAYDATLWVLGGYVIVHAGLAGLMTLYLAFRCAAGYVDGRRIGEARIVRLWADYAAATALLALAAAWAPGFLA